MPRKSGEQAAEDRPRLHRDQPHTAARHEPVNILVDDRLSLWDATDECRRQFIRHVLHEEHGNMSAAAGRLGMERANLYRLLRKLGITLTRRVALH